MTVKSTTRKSVILPDGTRVRRIIQAIKYDNSFRHPTNVRGKANIKGKLVKVVPMDAYMEQDIVAEEWKVVE